MDAPRSCLVSLSFAALLAAPTLPATAGIFPLEPGEAVVSCGTVPSLTTPPFYVLGIVDVRNADCDPRATPGQHWPAPMYHNEMPNPTMNPADEWTKPNLGDIFGVALDDLDPPNIYVASTSIYLSQPPAGDGRIHRIEGTTGAITLFQTLPNSGQGLGDIAFDAAHRQFFVTNHEDGRIYRLSFNGTLLDAFDPFTPDDGQPGYAPLGERLWGLGVHESRAYFGVWVEDEGRPAPPADNSVFSVGLDVTGGFVPADTTLELLLADVSIPPAPAFSSPVADIAFAPDGRMMLAERSMRDDERSSAHNSRMLEYSGGHLAWTPTAASFVVGMAPGTNSAGGVDYDCFTAGPCNTTPRVWGTGDALIFGPIDYIYGLQGIPESGGDVSTSYLVDLDGVFSFTSKTTLGDVEIRRSCLNAPCPDGPIAIAAPPSTACAGLPLLLDASPSISCIGSGLEYRWLEGATILCDWSTTATCAVTPMTATAYTLEVRCLDPRRVCDDAAIVTVDVRPVPLAELLVPPSMCTGGLVTLDASFSSSPLCGIGTMEFQFREGATILQAWGPSPTYGPFSPAATATYTVDVRCAGCEASASREIVVTPPPTVEVTPPVTACLGDTVRLDALPLSGCGPLGIEFEWREGVTIVCPWSPSPLCAAVPAATTTFDLHARCVDDPSCEVVMPVSVTAAPRPTAVAGPDTSTCEFSALVLDASASDTAACAGGALYEWWEGATLMRAAAPDPTWTPPTAVGTRTYTVRVYCVGSSGCDATDDVVVEVRACPLSVSFDTVRALGARDGSVEIVWTTSVELDSVLFVVERSTTEVTAFTRIGDVVPARGSGSAYTLVDTPAPSSGGRYRVVEYTSSGRGDVSAEVSPPPSRAHTSGGRGRRRR